MHIGLLLIILIIYIYCKSIYFSLYQFKNKEKNKKDLYLDGEVFTHNKLNRLSVYNGMTNYIVIPRKEVGLINKANPIFIDYYYRLKYKHILVPRIYKFINNLYVSNKKVGNNYLIIYSDTTKWKSCKINETNYIEMFNRIKQKISNIKDILYWDIILIDGKPKLNYLIQNKYNITPILFFYLYILQCNSLINIYNTKKYNQNYKFIFNNFENIIKSMNYKIPSYKSDFRFLKNIPYYNYTYENKKKTRSIQGTPNINLDKININYYDISNSNKQEILEMVSTRKNIINIDHILIKNRLISCGVFGCVYKNGNTILKVISDNLNKDNIDNILKERDISKKVSNLSFFPEFIGCFLIEENNNIKFVLEYEYIEGQTLKYYMKKNVITNEILTKLKKSIQYLDKNNIVRYDNHPNNIMINKNKDIIFIDMGLCDINNQKKNQKKKIDYKVRISFLQILFCMLSNNSSKNEIINIFNHINANYI